MYFDFTRLLDLEYFLDKTPGGDFMSGYPLLVFFVLTIFAKGVLKRFFPDNKYFRKSIRKRFGKFVALGIIGLILVSARFSGVPVFSMRLLLYIVFLLTLILGVLTFFKVRAEYLKRIASLEREKEKRGEL
ncbi:hypothetical protein K9M41_01605 [Candidatus Gracilibacteria bacterium]|nr:hypothetical protein [Candidatus Gracilibacteria bacterium]